MIIIHAKNVMIIISEKMSMFVKQPQLDLLNKIIINGCKNP